MSKYLICLLGALLIGTNAWSGDLALGATVTEVGNTSGNSRGFFIRVVTGTGPCTDGTIVFPESASQSTLSYAHALSLATTAFIHGKKVRVHNYVDDVCEQASYISISN